MIYNFPNNTRIKIFLLVWFAPIFGFMCKACHKFLANAKEQKEHIKDQGHSAAVAKFKKSVSNIISITFLLQRKVVILIIQ